MRKKIAEREAKFYGCPVFQGETNPRNYKESECIYAGVKLINSESE